ncbi:cytoskeleton-associated protein 5 [Lepeophtheirus salmonis]|uniref:cytoskeleton-associated protein 5 n=1 Tax=Lepeophtheirus salmonis TaxID=72036 RepID=UPI001AE0FB6F|nr:cytoskeleton-associated protein 5-like [Lepeophtheirus salmonis]
MAEDDSAYLKLPVEERCTHKIWKARLHGYEEVVKLFNSLDGDDEQWRKFHGLIKKFVMDINAVAQEKGLQAALTYAQNCDSAGSNTSEIIEGLVSKCVGASKAKTKDLAGQICLMFCEIETHDKVIEELFKGLSQKSPKTVAGCITIITACLRAFGTKVIKVSPLLKSGIPLLDHRDKGIREECKKLIIESYRWVGEIMKTQLTALKPVQLTELETEFEKLENVGKAKPARFIRSQQALSLVAGDEDNGDVNGCVGTADSEEEAIDPYDLIEPVDILSKIPKNFFELVEEKKWQARKEALDTLLPLTKTPKIVPGDFNELVLVLKKVISKDTNVIIVGIAAQCIAGISKGLRLSFKQGAVILLPACLEKFKEKKTTVVSGLQEAVDAMYPILGIETIQEDVLASLKHKTPAVNAESAKYLARCFAKCPALLVSNKKLLKSYITVLLEKLSVSDPSVRDSSSEALGVLMKFLGESSMMKFMPDLDNIKLSKIKEFCEKAELSGKSAAQLQAAAPKAKVVRPSSAPKVKIVSAASSSNDINKDDTEVEEDFTVPKKPLSKKAPQKKVTKGGKKASSSDGNPKEAKTSSSKSRFENVAAVASNKKKKEEDTYAPYINDNLKNSRFKDETKFKVLKWNFITPRPEFVEQLNDQLTNTNFNKTLVSQMFHNDFKQHIKVIDSLIKYLPKDLDGLKDNLDLILKWFTLRFFETNPSVLMKGLDYLKSVFKILAEDSYVLHEIEATSFVPYLVNKVGDPKEPIRNSIKEIFKIMSQVYAANKLVSFFMNGLLSKNSKQRTECLDELARLIKGYGISVLQPSPSNNLKEVAKQISDRDTSVRNAAMNTIAETYFQEGEKVYKMIGNLPKKEMTMLEERIKRASKTRQSVIPQEIATSPSNDKNANNNSPAPKAAQSGRSNPNPGQTESSLAEQQMVNQNNINDINEDINNQSNSHNNQRSKVSGAFTLNYKEIEAVSEHIITESGPRLISHNLDDIFEDVSLPKTQTSKRFSSTPSLQNHSNYIGSIPCNDNNKVYKEIDLVLSQVLSLDTMTALNAFTQLDDLIKDSEKVKFVINRLDQFIVACYNKYKHVLYTMMSNDNCNQIDVVKLFQFTTMVLMYLYHRSDIPKNTSLAHLHNLIAVMINILTEPKVHELPDSKSLIKDMYIVTIKIVDRSNHTNVTCVLLKLLKKYVPTSGLSPKFADLVMKCLWRIIRRIEQEMPQIQIDVLLAELHEFLKANPQSYWKMQEADTHLRTVKTIVYTLAKAKGPDIMNHLGKISDPENSELVPYLQKLMNGVLGTKKVVECYKVSSSTSKLPQFSKTHNETLAKIFKKIEEKELAKQGLKELYNFKQQNPLADLEPFFGRVSQYLRDYIEKGLKNIEMEVKSGSNHANFTLASGHVGLSSKFVLSDYVSNHGKGGSSSGQAYTYFLDRLKCLRTAGGLDNDDIGQEIKQGDHSYLGIYAPQSTIGSKTLLESPSDIHTSTSSNTRSNDSEPIQIDDIRRRLEKIKQSAFN